MRKIIAYILYFISFASIILASGITNRADWWNIAKPFFAIWAITLIVALILSYPNRIRRVIYPAFVCVSSWAYKYRIVNTKFAKNTYLIYKLKGRSYTNLFDYVQDLFDLMYG